MSEIVILGGQGFLGSGLYSFFADKGCKVERINRANSQHSELQSFDLRSFDVGAFRRFLKKYSRPYVLMCAGVSDIDRCALDTEVTRSINVEAQLTIAKLTWEFGGRPVFFSSDYVFDGEQDRPTEETPVSPRTEYGRQKVVVEEHLLVGANPAIVIRTSKILCTRSHAHNRLADIVTRLKRGEDIKLLSDQRFTPVFIEDIGRVIKLFMEREDTGLFHLGSRADYSWFELGTEIAARLEVSTSLVVPISLSQLKLVEPRNRLSTLAVSKVQDRLGSIEEDIYACLSKLVSQEAMP